MALKRAHAVRLPLLGPNVQSGYGTWNISFCDRELQSRYVSRRRPLEARRIYGVHFNGTEHPWRSLAVRFLIFCFGFSNDTILT